MNYIPVFKDVLPFVYSIKIAGETFVFTFNYNESGDFFTVDLFRGDEILCYGEKIVYGKPLISAFADERFPKAAIVPLDFAGIRDKVGFEEMESDVFLYVITQEEMSDALSKES